MPATPSIEVKRHYAELSEKETDELVAAVADLIVNFLKGSRELVQPHSDGVSAAGREIQS
jgi:hypothetical protein